jgi:hypothetical protein
MPARFEASALRELLGRSRRPVLVFVFAAIGLCALAGTRLTAPSKDNHFTHMAQGWLEGRLELPGEPPGFCGARERARGECRHHTFDDWARIEKLSMRRRVEELDEGQELRAFSCRTEACAELRKLEGIDVWYVLGRGWTQLPRGSYRRVGETWTVSFPPGPAVVMLPFVAIWGLAVWDVLITCLLAALVPAVLVHLLDTERGLHDGRGREHLWAALAWTFASPATFVGANGRVWFTAHIAAALFLCLHLAAAWRVRRPGWAGVWLGLAVACRPANMLPAAVFFALQWWREGRRLRAAVAFLVPMALIGGLLAWHNYARFEDPVEFGHRFLEIRWQARMQEVGMFSTEYFVRNVRVLLALMPQLQPSWPFVRVSIHGMALWLTTPWVFAAFAARERFPQRLGLWLAGLGAAVPSLLYQNSGQLQFTYRFAIDWLPFVLLAIVFGGGARRRWFPALVLLGVVVQVYGAWYYARAPGALFVTKPLGWPFEAEFGPGG